MYKSLKEDIEELQNMNNIEFRSSTLEPNHEETLCDFTKAVNKKRRRERQKELTKQDIYKLLGYNKFDIFLCENPYIKWIIIGFIWSMTIFLIFFLK